MYLDGTTVKYEAFSDGRRFTYMYDANGELYAVRLATYSNPTASAIYYYIYNLQGDVIALVNSANGQIVARYEYDAWGKPVAITDANGNAITDQSHIAHVNPFRYRGYYYDNETGLYYLNSRYYDPDTGRFVNSDGSISSESGLSLFVYCVNNPIKWADYDGYSPVLPHSEEDLIKIKDIAVLKEILEGENNVSDVDLDEVVVRDFDVVVAQNRKPGKFPNNKWPIPPEKLVGKKPKWNPDGYYEGKDGKHLTWDSKSHGAGQDRGNGPQDGHWDVENSKERYDRDGNPLGSETTEKIAYAAAGTATVYGIYLLAKWSIAFAAAPFTGGTSIGIALLTP